MKTAALGFLFALLLASVGCGGQGNNAFAGEIMDSACAGSGSHDAMMKEDASMATAKLCTEGCVAHGAKYVLYDNATKATYQLDDQTKPQQFAGDKVTVTGTLDNVTKTIHVADIKGAS